MTRAKTRTPLSADQLEDAARLKVVYDRVKRQRREDGGQPVTQDAMAAHCGWETQSAASQYINGAIALNLEALIKIAAYLGVPAAEISPTLAAQLSVTSERDLSTREPEAPGYHRRAMRPILVWETEDDLPPGQYALVPTLTLELSAGNGKKAVHVDYKQPKAFLADWIREKRLRPKNLVSMKATGDSMSPWVNDGDAVVVDLSDKEIRDGKPYAIRYGDELRIKNIHKRFDGGLILRSINPSFAEEVIPPADLEHVEILGLVVWRAG